MGCCSMHRPISFWLAGVQAYDPVDLPEVPGDGDITQLVSTSGVAQVDTSIATTEGEPYVVVYRVSDSAGNAALPVVRLVEVFNPCADKVSLCGVVWLALSRPLVVLTLGLGVWAMPRARRARGAALTAPARWAASAWSPQNPWRRKRSRRHRRSSWWASPASP